MKNNALKSLSTAINAYLQLDPESTARLKKLAGKVVTIELKPFDLRFQCHFSEKRLELLDDASLPADTFIAGTPLRLMALSLFKSGRQGFFADDVDMSGSAEVGHEVIELFDNMEIDWAEYLSHLIGDANSHRVSHLAKKAKSWISQVEQSFSNNINEYVHEEAEWFPTREALQDLFNDIDDFRMDVDRISAKIDFLKQQIQKENS